MKNQKQTLKEYYWRHREEKIAKAAAWNKAHKDEPSYRERMRWHQRKHVYGITKSEYMLLFEIQNGLCAICKLPETQTKDLLVDHNHFTKQLRGLLCNKCNKGVGLFQDNPLVLHNAATYLERK